MNPEQTGALTGGACCLVMWAALAAPVGWLAHWRMRRVEADLGRPALPADERALLFYAGASVFWLSALVVALVGLGKREWSRVGRNSTFLLLAHFTLVVFVALAAMTLDAFYGRSELRMLGLTAPLVALGATAALALSWRWSAVRTSRLEALPATGAEDPGALRWLAPIASFVVWPFGLVAVLVYAKPENARVGAWAFRASLASLGLIAWLVCAGMVALSLLL